MLDSAGQIVRLGDNSGDCRATTATTSIERKWKSEGALLLLMVSWLIKQKMAALSLQQNDNYPFAIDIAYYPTNHLVSLCVALHYGMICS